MKIKNVDQQNNAVNFTVEVDKSSWQEKVKKYFNQIAKNIKIEGFRPGKAPLSILEKRINKNEVYQKAINDSINETLPKLEESKEFESNTLELLERPMVDVKEVNDDALTLVFTYEVMPIISIKPYNKLDIDWSQREIVKKEEVQKDLERILEWNKKRTDVKDRALKANDLADINFVGSIDGKEFPGGKADNYLLKIGSKQFIDNFEDQLIGMNIGDEKTITVKFPANYHNKSFANKEAQFKVTLNGIKVEEKAKLNDEFAASLNFENVSTLKDLEKFVENQLQQKNDSIFKSKIQKDLLLKLVELVEASYIPQGLLNDEIRRIQNIFLKELKDQKTTVDKYIKDNNLDKDKIQAVFEKDAMNSIKYAFAIEQISKDNNLEVTDDEFDNYVKKVAQLYNLPFETIKSKLIENEELIKQDLLNDKIMDHIIKVNIESNPVKLTKSTTKKTTTTSTSTKSTKPATKKSTTAKSKEKTK